MDRKKRRRRERRERFEEARRELLDVPRREKLASRYPVKPSRRVHPGLAAAMKPNRVRVVSAANPSRVSWYVRDEPKMTGATVARSQARPSRDRAEDLARKGAILAPSAARRVGGSVAIGKPVARKPAFAAPESPALAHKVGKREAVHGKPSALHSSSRTDTLPERPNCKPRPGSRRPRRGGGSGRAYVPWCR